MASSTPDVVEMLKVAYNMELETVLNYLANSTNPDGVRAEEIKKSLAADITAELGHAQQLGNRIKQLGGFVDGSGSLKFGGPGSTAQEHRRYHLGDQGRDQGRRERLRSIQEDHLSRRRRRLRHPGHVHQATGRRRRAPDPLQGILEGVHAIALRLLRFRKPPASPGIGGEQDVHNPPAKPGSS